MRLVIRAEFRSVTCAGSMVTGSARSPITMASFGGAATAPEAKTTARVTRDSVATRRIVMDELLWPVILPQAPVWRNPAGAAAWCDCFASLAPGGGEGRRSSRHARPERGGES